MTNAPIIVSGEYADPFPKDAIDNVVDENGDVNWRAAFAADPGVKKCGGCATYYWNLARVMRCPKCGAEFGDGLCAPRGEGRS